MMFKKIICPITLLLFLVAPSFVVAANRLPDMLVGGTELAVGSQTVYGGPAGNYAVLNYDTDSSYGFNVADVNNCSPTMTKVGFCFVLGTGLSGTGNPGNNKLLVSRTAIINTDGTTNNFYETPALFVGGINVLGDAYGSNLSNFSFWGRNLAEGSANPDPSASYGIKNYSLNPDAQSSWNSAETADFKAEYTALAAEATEIKPASLLVNATTWYLQGSNITTDSLNSDKDKYPEGKVWLVKGDLALSSSTSYNYSGKGTIIVQGNFVADKDVTLHPPNNDTVSRLGIIVVNKNATDKGSCILKGNNQIQAAMLCENNFTVAAGGDNLELTGSFVAGNKFDLSGNPNNVSFFYDYNFDSAWPPGFRYLGMPSPKETGNQ